MPGEGGAQQEGKGGGKGVVGQFAMGGRREKEERPRNAIQRKGKQELSLWEREKKEERSEFLS